jgi:hypothetical protein
MKQSGGGRKVPTHTIADLSVMKTDDIENCYYPTACRMQQTLKFPERSAQV